MEGESVKIEAEPDIYILDDIVIKGEPDDEDIVIKGESVDEDIVIKDEPVDENILIKVEQDDDNITNDGCNVERDYEEEETKRRAKRCFVCNNCGFRAVSSRTLREHIGKSQCDLNVPQQKDKKFSCYICSFKSSWLWNVKMHILGIHKGIRPFPCSDCEYRATKSSDLKRHVLMRHRKEKPHQCSLCSYTCADSWNLKLHMMSRHTNERPFPCPRGDCGFRGLKSSDLKRHEQVKHKKNTKKYNCPYCVFKTTLPGYLRQHVKNKHS